jgi:isoleucyl-tRNA synthetase
VAVNLVKLEEETLDFWRKNQIFQKSLQQTKHQRPYVFYDGPPFATGLPHHGHLTASTIKDIIGRFWTMNGRHVERNWGWDCHGLPVEGEIHKKLGMSAEKAVGELGIAGYNTECRGIVDRYTAEWQKTIERLGRWVDFDNCYKTMDPEFMESVWWVFKQLWDKDLVYQGTKVMPFSTALGTPLSNFEAGSNYQDVQDPAVTVLFEKFYDVGDAPCWPTYFVAWTTTPWTLPSNLALAINPNITYVELVFELGDRPHPPTEYSHARKDGWIVLIMAEDSLERYPELKMKDGAGKLFWNILKKYPGSELVGQSYGDLSMVLSEKGLWPTWDQEKAHQILAADFVRTDTGTGIVHLAPAFGEDDNWACKQVGIKPVCPIDDSGCFTSEVRAYEGAYVKDADKQIVKDLKTDGRILQHKTVNHSYPHCPRTDTPLIYKMVPCWYIAVEKIKDKLLAANTETSWVPEHIKEGRFGSWLENAQDWCVSRNRVWGTPIPIWKNDVTGNAICMGSAKELAIYAGQKPLSICNDCSWAAEEPPPEMEECSHCGWRPNEKSWNTYHLDFHRENADGITFTVDGEEGVYHRIPEIFDCWFESGSMPYAQMGYPNTEKKLEDSFPADFIAEGLDQTRGWFYTLTVLSAALFDKPAFKNVIVNGIVLAADGKKMSKRLKNYTDPMILLDQYGADALRLYLINSGLTKAEDLKFVDGDIKANIKSVILPWYNVHKFFVTYAKIDGWHLSLEDYDNDYDNQLDRWLIEEMRDLISFINQEMKAYRLFNIVPEVAKFFDSFANTYVRLNRRRFWGPGLPDDKRKGYAAYFGVLKELATVLAPITPFLSEHLFQELKPFGKYVEDDVETIMSVHEKSVHLTRFPTNIEKEDDGELLQAVRLMQQVILLGRRKREQEKIEIKTPLRSLKIIHKNASLLGTIRTLERYIKSELNVKKLHYHQDEDTYIEIYAKPNFRTLGKRLGKRIKQYKPLIERLTKSALKILEDKGFLIISEEMFTYEDILVYRRARKGTDTVSNRLIGIELDCELTPALIREGLARKVVSLIQSLRKEKDFELTDRITVRYWTLDEELEIALVGHGPYIMEETLCQELTRVGPWGAVQGSPDGQSFDLDDKKLYLEIIKI